MDPSEEVGEDYQWTAGNDIDLEHKRLIACGAFGEVHEVYHLIDNGLLR